MDKTKKELISLAKAMESYINFNYVTLCFSDGLNCPLIQFWTHKPQWIRFIDDFGDVYEIWNSSENSSWSVCIAANSLVPKYFQNLTKDFMYKDYIVSKKDIM